MKVVLILIAVIVAVGAVSGTFAAVAQSPTPEPPTPTPTGSVIPATETPIPVIPTISPSPVSTTVSGIVSTATPVPTVVSATVTMSPTLPPPTPTPDTNALIAELTRELVAIHDRLDSIEDLANKVPVLEAGLVDLIDLYDQQRDLLNTVALNMEALATPVDWTQWQADWEATRQGIEAEVVGTLEEVRQANQSASSLNISATNMFELMRAWILSQPQPGQPEPTAEPAPPSNTFTHCNQCVFER